LAVRRAAKTVTSILPHVSREEQGRDLTEIEVVNNAQRLRSCRARPEGACKGLAFVLGQPLLNPPRGRLGETSGINLTDDATQGALGLHNALPHGLGAG